MRYKHPTLFAANLLAYLEATFLGLVDGPEEERQRASRIAATVAQTESRNWRAHGRPSPGRSRSMRRMGLSLSLVVLTALGLAGPADAGVCPGEGAGCGEVDLVKCWAGELQAGGVVPAELPVFLEPLGLTEQANLARGGACD